MAAPKKARTDGRAADAHDVGQVELAFAQLTDHRAAEVRVLDRGRGYVAGMELVGGALMVAFLVGHRPDERDVFHDLRGLIPALGDRDGRDGRRDGFCLAAVIGAGLGVERFELARPSAHPEQDARHPPFPQIVGVKCHPVREAQGNRGRGGQPGRSQRERLEEVAAVDHPRAVHRHLHGFFFECHELFLACFPGDERDS